MTDNNMLIVPENLSGHNKEWKVFLAGPIQGAPMWQFSVPKINNVVWLSPRRPYKVLNDFNHTEQVEWETQGLRMANIVLFWIPKEEETVDGRSYAQTSRFELGEMMARGKRIILGAHKDFPGRKYFEYKATKYSNVIGGKVHESLEDCLQTLKDYIAEAEINKTVYFTSDTHFSSERALKLSYRPFKTVDEMDWTMIDRWNSTVNPCDRVYHLGDFGEDWTLDYLSGSIVFVEGNYEREGKTKITPEKINVYSKGLLIINIDNRDYIIGHEPRSVKEGAAETPYPVFGLYGHIHGRQRIKKFGMDVGVDCSNYTPVSLKEVQFYENAILNGYYDNEVWDQ